MIPSTLKIAPEIIAEPRRLSVYFSGKLLLRQEIPLAEADFQQLLVNGQFSAVPSISQTLFLTKCHRCGNRKRSLFGHIPCQRCYKTHLYCRKCIEMGRVLACEPLYIWTGANQNGLPMNNRVRGKENLPMCSNMQPTGSFKRFNMKNHISLFGRYLQPREQRCLFQASPKLFSTA